MQAHRKTLNILHIYIREYMYKCSIYVWCSDFGQAFGLNFS